MTPVPTPAPDMNERDLIFELTDALQEMRQLVAWTYEGRSWSWESEGMVKLTRARDVLEIAEDYRERGIEALADYEATT